MKVSFEELWLVPVAMHTFSLSILWIIYAFLNMHLKWSSWNVIAFDLLVAWLHRYFSYLQLRVPILESYISKQLIWIQSRFIFKYCNFIFPYSSWSTLFWPHVWIFAAISVLPSLRKMMRWRMHILLLHLLVTLM